MSEEIFDVVNERDEVVGQKPRREVHRTGLKHRAVHAAGSSGSRMAAFSCKAFHDQRHFSGRVGFLLASGHMWTAVRITMPAPCAN